MAMRILNLIPDHAGGIESYHEYIKRYLTVSSDYRIIGKRPDEKKGLCHLLFRMAKDYVAFIAIVRKGRYDLVQINPSLDARGIVRDGIFLIIAKTFGLKVVVFIHGWYADVADFIQRRFKAVFRGVFSRADALIVLSEKFKGQLRYWGFKNPIHVESTVVDDAVFSEANARELIERRCSMKRWRLLFLAKVLKQKGIYETLDFWRVVNEKTPADLIVAGDGEELENVRKLATDKRWKGISFPGYVSGAEKRRAFENAHVYCLFSHTEGMPVAVIEAMAHGLPVLTRWVGRLPEFFINGVHGYATESLSPEVFAGMFFRLIENPAAYRRMAEENRRYVWNNFRASTAAGRMEAIYRKVVSSRSQR